MGKYTSLYIYSGLMVLSGLIVLYMNPVVFEKVKMLFMILFSLSAIFAFLTAQKSKVHWVPFQYHAIHGAGLAVFSLFVFFVVNTYNQFLLYSTIYLLYYGITELIYGILIFQGKEKMVIKVVLLRMIGGFFIGIMAVITFISLGTFLSANFALKIIGVLIMLSGINTILFKTVLKRLYFWEKKTGLGNVV